MTDSNCPTYEAGMKKVLMTVDLPILMKGSDGPKRKADLVRKAPDGFYAYLKERVKGRIVYHVVYIKTSRRIYAQDKGSPGISPEPARHEFLGWVHKIGTKFFAQKHDSDTPRCKGSTSLKKATQRLVSFNP